MKDFFRYEFNADLNILNKYYYGPICLEDIFTSWEYAFNNNIVSDDIKGFVLSFEEANYNFNALRFTEIISFYDKHLDVFKGKKVALITVNPADTVIPFLFKTKAKGYLSEPFSTKSAAIDWIIG